MPRRRLALALAFVLCPVARADDWPQWLGPHRDGVWRETDILDKPALARGSRLNEVAGVAS